MPFTRIEIPTGKRASYRISTVVTGGPCATYPAVRRAPGSGRAAGAASG